MGKQVINPYALWLTSIKGVGGLTIRALMETAENAEEVYHMSEDELRMCLSDRLKKNSDVADKSLSIFFAQKRDPAEEAEKLGLLTFAPMEKTENDSGYTDDPEHDDEMTEEDQSING